MGGTCLNIFWRPFVHFFVLAWYASVSSCTSAVSVFSEKPGTLVFRSVGERSDDFKKTED